MWPTGSSGDGICDSSCDRSSCDRSSYDSRCEEGPDKQRKIQTNRSDIIRSIRKTKTAQSVVNCNHYFWDDFVVSSPKMNGITCVNTTNITQVER